MSDFLHNLRTGNMDKQRYTRNKRPVSNSANYNDVLDRRAGNERRDLYSKKQPQQNTIYPLLEKAVAILKISLEDISDNQKALMEISEQRAAAEIRKAKALEAIAELIDYKFSERVDATSQNIPEEEIEEEIQAKSDRNNEKVIIPQTHFDFESKKTNRNKIIEIIIKMRQADATYGEIASHLENQNLPTFSKRGKWHAQTVHRICQNHL